MRKFWMIVGVGLAFSLGVAIGVSDNPHKTEMELGYEETFESLNGHAYMNMNEEQKAFLLLGYIHGSATTYRHIRQAINSTLMWDDWNRSFLDSSIRSSSRTVVAAMNIMDAVTPGITNGYNASYPRGWTVDYVSLEVTDFYQKRSMRNIPIPEAVLYATAEQRGASKEALKELLDEIQSKYN